MNLLHKKSQTGKKLVYLIFYIFLSFLLECELLTFNSPWEIALRGKEGGHIFAVQPAFQPLQNCCCRCSKARGWALHSDLSAEQQRWLSVVQRPLKIVGISALTPVTSGSNALKYQCYVPAGRHQGNTALLKKMEKLQICIFLCLVDFFFNTEYVLANICCMIRNSFSLSPSLFLV